MWKVTFTSVFMPNILHIHVNANYKWREQCWIGVGYVNLSATIKSGFSTSVMQELPDTRANTSYDVKKNNNWSF